MATGSGADTLLRERRELMFPTLTTEQVARIGNHGRRRTVDRGKILIDRGDRVEFFVIIDGEVETLQGGEGPICISLVHQALRDENTGHDLGGFRIADGVERVERTQIGRQREVLEFETPDIAPKPPPSLLSIVFSVSPLCRGRKTDRRHDM